MTDKPTPTDAEIRGLAATGNGVYQDDETAIWEITDPSLMKFAHAVLAKRGQPAQAVELVAWRVHPFDYRIGHEGVYAMTMRENRRETWKRKGWNPEPLFTAPQPVAREPVESSDRRWLCLLCKSSREGAHGVLDDSITPCPNGIKGGQHGTESST